MRNQPETRITSKLVDSLEEMCHGWIIEVEANPFTVGSKKLDAFVTQPGREPVAIEAKYADTHTEEKLREQAVSRLVRELVPDRAYDSVTNTLNTVMVIRYPIRFNECYRAKQKKHDAVRAELDRRVLELLGITDKAIHDAMKTLRMKLSREPSIQGTKKSQCNLKAELARLKKKGLPFPSWYG